MTVSELRLKMDDIDRVVLVGGKTRKTASTIFNELEDKPDYLINGGMYSTSGKYAGLTVCDTIINGNLINGGNYTDKGFAWNDKDFEPNTSATAKMKGCKFFLGGSPSLIWDSKLKIDGKGFDNDFLNEDKGIRIGMGVDGEDLVFSFPKQKITLGEFAGIMKSMGCEYAINLDGGGSTSVMQNVNGKLQALNNRTENRANSTWLAIYLKEDKKLNKEKPKSVWIDAGHGGNDPGAVGQNGTKEKDIVLKIAKIVSNELKRHGVEVYMSREDDSFLELSERSTMANEADTDMFVSIHVNASDTNKEAKGTECYSYGTTGNGYKIATKIQNQIVALGKTADRGVKSSNFHVLKRTNMSAVLVETAFISNKEEEKLLNTSEFQYDVAVAIAKGILDFFNIEWVESAENKPREWYAEAQEFCIANGLTTGERPNDAITRAEVFVLLERFYKFIKKDV